MKKYIAEFIGTFWLVLGGCGSAVIALRSLANDPITLGEGIRYPIGIGLLGVSFAFGLTVLTMAYAIGHISGCHLNPAVSFGLWAGKRFPGSELLPYIISQVLGAILAGFFVYLLASGKAGFVIPDGNPLASNGYGDHSPEGYGLVTCFITEAIMTFMFTIVILGSTDRRAPAGFAPLAIGLGLTLIHLITIPITATSVNPARSTGPAIVAAIVGQPALVGQLWMFWIAPILGALLAGWLYASVFAETRAERIEAEAQAQEGVEV